MAKHDFHLAADGERDDSRIDGDRHNGPLCRVCGEFFCIHCEPERVDEECDGLDRSAYVTVSVSYLPEGATEDAHRQVISRRVTVSAEEVAAASLVDPVRPQLLRAVDEVLGTWERRPR